MTNPMEAIPHNDNTTAEEQSDLLKLMSRQAENPRAFFESLVPNLSKEQLDAILDDYDKRLREGN